jgi:hypothetical protein
MAQPPEFPERRRDHALRAAYKRIEDLEERVEGLEKNAVTKLWLYSSALTIAAGAFLGVLKFLGEVEDAAQKPIAAQTAIIAKQGEKLDRFIETQTASNIKTEAMYLNSIERRPREEVREAVLRSTTKEK